MDLLFFVSCSTLSGRFARTVPYVIIIIIIIAVIFMQGIYIYTPQTNHVSRVCNCSVFTICATCNVIWHVKHVLYLYISPFRSFCAVPNVAVFCSSLISHYPGMLLMYCLSDSEMVPVAPVITGITFAVTFHMRCNSVIRSLYFKILSSPFLITFVSPAIATSVDMHVPFL